MHQSVPLFAHEHSKRKPKFLWKRCHWVTPLFKSGISLLSNNGVTQWRRFCETLCFFSAYIVIHHILEKNISKISARFCKNVVIGRHYYSVVEYLYFWLMVLPNDDVFGELRPFFDILFSNIWRIIRILVALSRNQSISIPTKCAPTPTFFWCTDSSWIMFVLAQCSANFRFHQLHCALTNNKPRCTVQCSQWKPAFRSDHKGAVAKFHVYGFDIEQKCHTFLLD